jgi:5-methylcytosine-specific restriction endonuclease McrA
MAGIDFLTGEYLEEFNEQKERHEAQFACSWDHSAEYEYRRRVIKGGTTHVYRQCPGCGIGLGAARRSLFTREEIEALPAYEEDLQKTRYQDMRQAIERCREVLLDKQRRARNQKSGTWWTWYNEYLTSPEWKRKREAVLRRAAGRCEGCGINTPAQIHHLTYKHVGNEFLFELAAVCVACHDRLHEEKQEGES